MVVGTSSAVCAGLLGGSAAAAISPRLTGLGPFAVGAAAGAVIGGVAYVVLSRMDRDDVVAAISHGKCADDTASDEGRSSVRLVESASASRARHMAASGRAGVPHTARHFRTVDWEQTGTILVQDPATPKAASHAAPQGTRANSSLSSLEADRDYADIAQEYVKRVTLTQRMATVARGVANVLGERLGSGMMDGIPVIQRADGTVADVGTTWWDEAMTASGKDAVEIESAREVMVQPDEIRYAPKATSLDDTAPQAADMRPEPKPAMTFSQSVAARIADVDMGLYPEHRSAKDLEGRQDVWAAALEALDEKTYDPLDLIFVDDIGDAGTLDEPDGLELPTDFIPFRAPAGHPEVVDTETYVDYLIRQEFTRNPSSAVRRNAREYLHVIEGGTAGMLRDRTERPRGKHFKADALPLALEA